VGAGLLLFVYAAVVVRGATSAPPRPAPLDRLALAAIATAGALKLLAAFGIGAAFMHSRNLTVAVLHLVLLGIVTPAFVLAMRPALRARMRAAVFGAGLFVMLAALVATAWPWAARTLLSNGVSLTTLFVLTFSAGAVAAVALLAPVIGAQRTVGQSAHRALPPCSTSLVTTNINAHRTRRCRGIRYRRRCGTRRESADP
jgi:hypothetical protein